MAAGIAQLTILKNNPQIYEELNQKSDTFFETMKENVRKSGHAWQVNHVGSIGSCFSQNSRLLTMLPPKPQILLSMHGILNICWTMESILHRHSLKQCLCHGTYGRKSGLCTAEGGEFLNVQMNDRRANRTGNLQLYKTEWKKYSARIGNIFDEGEL